MSVAIVSFNTRALLGRCLQSVAAARPVETIVVDNGSTDGSVELVRDGFPSVRIIANSSNRGYGAAANQAISAWSTPAGLLLNSDTIIAPDALDALGGYLNRRPTWPSPARDSSTPTDGCSGPPSRSPVPGHPPRGGGPPSCAASHPGPARAAAADLEP